MDGGNPLSWLRGDDICTPRRGGLRSTTAATTVSVWGIVMMAHPLLLCRRDASNPLTFRVLLDGRRKGVVSRMPVSRRHAPLTTGKVIRPVLSRRGTWQDRTMQHTCQTQVPRPPQTIASMKA